MGIAGNSHKPAPATFAQGIALRGGGVSHPAACGGQRTRPTGSRSWTLAVGIAGNSHKTAPATFAQGVAPGYRLAAPLGL